MARSRLDYDCFCTTLVIISTIVIEFNLNLPFFLLVVPWDVSE